MNLLMCLRIALVGYIVLCEHSESHPRGFYPRFVWLYALRVRRKKSTTREAQKKHYAWGEKNTTRGAQKKHYA